MGAKFTVNLSFKRALIATWLLLLVAPSQVFSADLKWSGRYRVEGIFIKNQTLANSTGQGVENSYFLHHLILEPKIIAADGLNIHGRFDVFNNSLPNNQAGQVFGSYNGTTTTGGQPQPPATLTHTLQSETIQATQLYLNWVNEFGALVAGRVPFHFGLGMTFSGGNGPFDHYFSTKDLVGYKLALLGNLLIMPAYGKVREGSLFSEDDVNDYIILTEYNNPETNLSMGFLFDSRVAPTDTNAPTQGNDFPLASFPAGALYDSGYNAYNMNFFVKKQSENFNFGVELGFLTGYSGVVIPNGAGGFDRVELSGFGLAGEASYKAGDLTLGLMAGLASGDDADTSRFEGYFFNPNYRLGMLMFAYPLGQYDALKSTLAGLKPAANSVASGTMAGLDTEVISNAIYIAPNIKYALGERYDLLGNLCYALLHKQPNSSTLPAVSSSLGFEVDLGLSYHPTDRFTWVTTLGFLFPGGAWAGSVTPPFKTEFSYGATTKAAISF